MMNFCGQFCLALGFVCGFFCGFFRISFILGWKPREGGGTEDMQATGLGTFDPKTAPFHPKTISFPFRVASALEELFNL